MLSLKRSPSLIAEFGKRLGILVSHFTNHYIQDIHEQKSEAKIANIQKNHQYFIGIRCVFHISDIRLNI